VENFAKGAHQADDLTLLIVRYRATPAVAMIDTDISSSSSGKSFAPTATITGPGPGGSEVALQPTLPSPVAPKLS
jgi:hypothetical protein